MKYDYVIVGSGLFGSVFANKATEAGKKCIIIEKKDKIGGNEAYYPMNDVHNNEKYKAYKDLANKDTNMILGGRLADYKYYGMHQVIGSAMAKAEKDLG